MDDTYSVVVKFGIGIPADMQGVCMLAMERWLRDHEIPAIVSKEVMADDSRLRLSMTPAQRASL